MLVACYFGFIMANTKKPAKFDKKKTFGTSLKRVGLEHPNHSLVFHIGYHYVKTSNNRTKVIEQRAYCLCQ